MTNRISWKQKYNDSLLQYDSMYPCENTGPKKYELLKDDVYTEFLKSWGDDDFPGYTLYRIRALRDFGDVKVGDLGGYIQHYGNLSHTGNSWVGGDAKVCNWARVFNNGQIDELVEMSGTAAVYGNAKVTDEGFITGNAKAFGNAQIYGWSVITDNAIVSGNAEINRGWIRENAIVTGDTKIRRTGCSSYYEFPREYNQCIVMGSAVLNGNEWYNNKQLIEDNNVYEQPEIFDGVNKGRWIREIKNND